MIDADLLVQTLERYVPTNRIGLVWQVYQELMRRILEEARYELTSLALLHKERVRSVLGQVINGPIVDVIGVSLRHDFPRSEVGWAVDSRHSGRATEVIACLCNEEGVTFVNRWCYGSNWVEGIEKRLKHIEEHSQFARLVEGKTRLAEQVLSSLPSEFRGVLTAVYCVYFGVAIAGSDVEFEKMHNLVRSVLSWVPLCEKITVPGTWFVLCS